MKFVGVLRRVVRERERGKWYSCCSVLTSTQTTQREAAADRCVFDLAKQGISERQRRGTKQAFNGASKVWALTRRFTTGNSKAGGGG